MKKMSGIIFSNVYDNEFGQLTANRTVASLPFGGRYRQIDFALSNMANSNITSIGVITKYNYESLMEHMGSCEEWDLNHKNGGVTIIPPYAFGMKGVYHGKLEALYNALRFLKSLSTDYLVLSDTITICNIDYSEILKEHIKSEKDITSIVYALPCEIENNKSVYELDAEGRVKSILVNCRGEVGDIVGLGMYIMNREALIGAVENCIEAGFCHFEKDFIQRLFNKGTLSVNIYKYNGVVLRNSDIPTFLENNLLLADEDIRNGIFKSESPIYTKVRDEIPTFYGKNSSVDESIIADGCYIDGEVVQSTIFRNVKIEKGAKVVNSVIMQGTKICQGAYVKNVIIDTDATITENTKLIGSKNAPVLISKGETI